MKDVYAKWMGLTPFNQALELQKKALVQVHGTGTAQLLGLEHPEVLTLGVRAKTNLEIINKDDAPEIFHVSRGGHGTIHNPGQLVIYPILSLRTCGLGVREYVQLLIEVSKDFFC